MATIGQELTAPESGWQRIGCMNSNITYSGTWQQASETGFYNNQYKYTAVNGSTFELYFYGTEFRLTEYRYSNRGNVKITFDGVEETINTSGTPEIKQCLVYEKTGLTEKIHYVKWEKLSGTYCGINAIDIDDTGRMATKAEYEAQVEPEEKVGVMYYPPTNTTTEILAKTNDTRVGLLGMANDGDNYGDLYVIGTDNKAHLTKGGIKSEVIFEGTANAIASYTLANSITNYKELRVIVDGKSSGAKFGSICLPIIVDSIGYNMENEFFANLSIPTSSRYIAFTFGDSQTLIINSLEKGSLEEYAITKIIGIY